MRERVWIAGASIAAAVALGFALLNQNDRVQSITTDTRSGPAQETQRPEDPDDLGAAVAPEAARSPILDRAPGGAAVLTVVDGNEVPVDGARVHVESPPGWTLAGTTDADGRISFGGGEGLVRHPHYLPGEFEVPPEGHLILVLEPGGAIDGVVTGLDADGMAECQIVARQRSDRSSTLVEDIERGSPRVIETTGCRPDGSFRLTGVVPGRQYVVEGSVRGMASAPAEVTAGTAESPGHVVVEMIDVWGAQVVFTGPGGERLHCPERIDVSRSSPAMNFIPTLPTGFRHASGLYGLSLHRLSRGTRQGMLDGRFRALVLMTPEPGAGRVPVNVPFSFQLPGYEPSSGEVQIRPLREEITVFEVELTPRAESFGSLNVEFLGTEYLDRYAPRMLADEYELRLQAKGGDVRIAASFSVPLHGQNHLEGIPAGVYDATFEGLGKSLKIVPEGSPVRIGPDSTPQLTIELGTFGSIEVELIRADGTLYDSGPIRIQLLTETEPGLGRPMFYHLPGPPYLIHHVAPGPHYLVLLTPEEVVYRDPDAVPLDTVFVSESNVTTVRFFLP